MGARPHRGRRDAAAAAGVEVSHDRSDPLRRAGLACLLARARARDAPAGAGMDDSRRRSRREPLLAADPDHPGQRRQARAGLDASMPARRTCSSRRWSSAGVMYLTAGSNIFALEPETGKADLAVRGPRRRSAGAALAYWPGDAKTPARLFTGAGDSLVALDAKTGQPGARVRHARTGRARARHHGRRRRPHQPGVAAARSSRTRHHRRQQRRAGAEPRPLRRHPRLGRPHRGAAMDIPYGAAGRRAGRRDLGRRQLEEPIRHQHVVVLHHRRRARHRLRAARVADRRLLRRRSQGEEPLRQLDRRARRRPPAR